MKKSEVDIIAEAIGSFLTEEWHTVLVNGKHDSSHAKIQDAQKRMAALKGLDKKGSDKQDKIEIVQKKYVKEEKDEDCDCGCEDCDHDKKTLKEDSSIFDRINMRAKGIEHANRVKQLQRTIERADRLADKHSSYAFLHDDIGEDPSHPKHVSPEHHREKYDKHMRKSKMLQMYVDAFKEAMDD